MSRGRKERTPAQLAVLAQAREKAKIVIAERAERQRRASRESLPLRLATLNAKHATRWRAVRAKRCDFCGEWRRGSTSLKMPSCKS